MTSSRPPTRFLPTLTEVVRPGATVVGESLSQDALVARVLQRVVPLVEARVRAQAEVLVQESLKLLAAQLQQDVQLAVRQTLADAESGEQLENQSGLDR